MWAAETVRGAVPQGEKGFDGALVRAGGSGWGAGPAGPASLGNRTTRSTGVRKGSITERKELPDLQRREGLWRAGRRAFVVLHMITEGELKLFDTCSRMLTVSRGFTNSEGTTGGNSRVVGP